jgi:3-keto-5-aminohexanoate cleavage enzyme
VCAAGRASSYLAIFALLLGLNIRIGMEDTVWMWPHRNEMIKKNVEHFKMFKQIIELMGREIIAPAEFREKLGMRKPGGKLKAA